MILGVKAVANMTNEMKRLMDSVQASMAVEGLKPSKKAKVISRKYLMGELSSKEAVALITEHHMAKGRGKCAHT